MSQCILCNERLSVCWTDTHGVAICVVCGLPYTIIHYEGEGAARRRVEKPAEPAITDRGMEIARAYWNEVKRRVFPAAYDFLPGNAAETYSGATLEEVRMFNEWWKANEERFSQPKKNEETKA